jgi:Protein of unknown function (DUF1579)
MEMPKAQEQHKKLQDLSGTWTGEETMHPSPWDPQGGKATSRIVSRMEVDGFFLVSDYVQERGGRPTYRGHGVFGYDADQKCYTMHWFDSMCSPTGEPGRGTWEGNRLVFDQKSPMGHGRFTYEFEGKDRYRFQMEHSQDGKQWAKFLDAIYTKK